jgi:glycosyltransferase involved in cell wall biosynthesis
MKVLGLIASPTDPASRFRILQYFPYLEKLGIETDNWYTDPTQDSSPADWTKVIHKYTSINPWRTWDIIQNISRLPLLVSQFGYDMIWQSRLLLPYLFMAEKAIAKPLVFDIDDAIWLIPGTEKRVQRAVAEADEVFAGNAYLAEWCSQWNKKVSYIPGTVDLSRYFPVEKKDGPFTIGWIGTPSNFQYLQLIKEPLEQFLFKYSNTRFVIISNSKPEGFTFDSKKIVFKEWQEMSENEMINEFDVGIMPLQDDAWAKGKCGYKLLQYMACQIPVVASPVGVNIQLLQTGTGLAASASDEWFKAFETLFLDREMATNFGANGRRLIEREYSTATWAPIVAEKFKALQK